MAEGRHDVVRDDGLEVVRHTGQRIEADRPLDVGRIDVNEVISTGARHEFEDGFGEVAMGIEQRDAGAGGEVLANEVEQQGTLAGAGLPDDVEVPAALVVAEHDKVARCEGANTQLMALVCHSRNGAGVPCAPQVGIWRGRRPFPGVRRGYMASVVCA